MSRAEFFLFLSFAFAIGAGFGYYAADIIF